VSETPPEGPNPFDLLASAQEALAAQADAVNQTVEGSAGGGVVKVEMTGGGEVTGLVISPEVVDPDDVEMLQDLVLAALRDANTKAAALQRQALGAFGQLDLGDLGGSLGGALGGMLGGVPGGAPPGIESGAEPPVPGHPGDPGDPGAGRPGGDPSE
jgi:DNA-binding YbaB/EbfC family protein